MGNRLTGSHPRIVVGLTEARAAGRALRWAAGQAEIEHAVLEVVTTYPTSARREPEGLVEWQRETTQAVLGPNPRVRVHEDLVEGDPVEVLCSRGVGARYLVVGRSRLHRRLFKRSVATRCAAFATCEVVVVGNEVGIDDPLRPSTASKGFVRR